MKAEYLQVQPGCLVMSFQCVQLQARFTAPQDSVMRELRLVPLSNQSIQAISSTQEQSCKKRVPSCFLFDSVHRST